MKKHKLANGIQLELKGNLNRYLCSVAKIDSEQILIISTVKEIYKISFKDKAFNKTKFKTISKSDFHAYFSCLEVINSEEEPIILLNVDKVDDRENKKNIIMALNYKDGSEYTLKGTEFLKLNPIFFKSFKIGNQSFVLCSTDTCQVVLFMLKLSQSKKGEVEFIKIELADQEYKCFTIDIDVLVLEGELFLVMSSIDGHIRLVSYRIFPGEKNKQECFQSKYKNLDEICKFEVAVSHVDFVIEDKDTSKINIYGCSVKGFCFLFENIKKNSLSKANTVFEAIKMNCITAFDIKQFQDKKKALVCHFNGIVSLYDYPEEFGEWELIVQENLNFHYFKAFLYGDNEDAKYVILVSDNCISIYNISKNMSLNYKSSNLLKSNGKKEKNAIVILDSEERSASNEVEKPNIRIKTDGRTNGREKNNEEDNPNYYFVEDASDTSGEMIEDDEFSQESSNSSIVFLGKGKDDHTQKLIIRNTHLFPFIRPLHFTSDLEALQRVDVSYVRYPESGLKHTYRTDYRLSLETVNRTLIGIPRRLEDPFPNDDKNEYLMDLYKLEDKFYEWHSTLHEITFCEKELAHIQDLLLSEAIPQEIDHSFKKLLRFKVLKNENFTLDPDFNNLFESIKSFLARKKETLLNEQQREKGKILKEISVKNSMAFNQKLSGYKLREKLMTSNKYLMENLYEKHMDHEFYSMPCTQDQKEDIIESLKVCLKPYQTLPIDYNKILLERIIQSTSEEYLNGDMNFPPAIFTAPLEDSKSMDFIYLLLLMAIEEDPVFIDESIKMTSILKEIFADFFFNDPKKIEKNKKRQGTISPDELELLSRKFEQCIETNKFLNVQPFSDLLSHPLFERNHKPQSSKKYKVMFGTGYQFLFMMQLIHIYERISLIIYLFGELSNSLLSSLIEGLEDQRLGDLSCLDLIRTLLISIIKGTIDEATVENLFMSIFQENGKLLLNIKGFLDAALISLQLMVKDELSFDIFKLWKNFKESERDENSYFKDINERACEKIDEINEQDYNLLHKFFYCSNEGILRFYAYIPEEFLDSQASEMIKAENEIGPEIIDLEVVMEIKDKNKRGDSQDESDVIMMGIESGKRRIQDGKQNNRGEFINKKLKLD